MSNVNAPLCIIIAGPNGAGKTTFALKILPEYILKNGNFVNADWQADKLLADGEHPHNISNSGLMKAGRVHLKRIKRRIEERTSFAFETTLAGRTYLRTVRQLSQSGWHIELHYLWLSDVNIAIKRVAERVADGGHDIPEEIIARRYPLSIVNLFNYAPLCHQTICWDNSKENPEVIFIQNKADKDIRNQKLYDRIKEQIKMIECNEYPPKHKNISHGGS